MKNSGVLGYLSYVVYAFLIAYFVLMSAKAVKNRKKCGEGQSGFLSVIVAAAVNAVILIHYDMFLSDGLSGHLVSSVGLALMPVFLSGLSDRTVHIAVAVSSVVAVFSIAMFILRPYIPAFLTSGGLWVSPVMTVVSAVAVLALSVFAPHDDTSGTPSSIRILYVRTNMLYFLAFTVLLMAGAYIGTGVGAVSTAASCLCLVMLLLLFTAMCTRLACSRIFFFIKGYEEHLVKSMPLKEMDVSRDMTDEDRGYHAIFERLKHLFEEEKPFLDPEISVSDVARSLFTNKAYLSRTINLYTGRNFCQFVNYYRIRYAVSLFQAQPDMKLADLAERSGFRTVNSFSMAFRLYMNMTPGEWCRKYKHNANNGA